MSGRAGLADWLMLLGLTVMWGSAFLFTKIAVTWLPADWVVAGRLAVAVVLLVPAALLLAGRLPRGRRMWVFLVLIALLGNALPFSLITWGQRYIDSGLAGILMAIMPLATLGLAHFFIPGERITPYRVAGFLLGFAGVVVLLGPEALSAGVGGSQTLVAMLAVLGGAVCYAVSAILARLRPPAEALPTAAAVTLLAMVMMLPLVGGEGAMPTAASASPSALGAVLFLGAFSTATAMVVYFRLIARAGPSFVSQLNYLIPLWAVGIGIAFLGEAPQVNQLYALTLILGGIAATQLERRRIGLAAED